jgi:hypothetical protein
MKFQVNTSDTTTKATYTIAGVTETDESKLKDLKFFNGDTTTEGVISTAQTGTENPTTYIASGNGYVTVTITPAKEVITNYTVSVADALKAGTGVALDKFGITNADKTSKLTVSVLQASVPADGKTPFKTSNIQVSIDTMAAGYEYKVTIDGFGSANVTAAGTGTSLIPADVMLDSNVTIEQADITVELVESKVAVVAEESGWSGNIMTLVFTEALDKTEAEKIANYTLTAGGSRATVLKDASLSDDGKTLTLTFDLNLDTATAADTVKLAATNIKSARTAANAIAAKNGDLITVAADGKITVGNSI